ncbi:MAG: 2TM domain-containing protein [Rhodospirillales bacterium]
MTGADAERRLRGLALHFGAFIVVIALLAVVDFAFFPERVYVIFPAVLWGAPLSLHTAYAMGLFDMFKRDR